MRITVATAVACLTTFGLSMAQNVEAAVKKQTTIPAQGLGPALQQLAKDRNVQMVYRSEIVGARQTSGASGELTFEAKSVVMHRQDELCTSVVRHL